MRCLSCNVILTDKEATRKYASSGTFVDLCDNCLDEVADEFQVIEGKGSKHVQETQEEDKE